ncbi:MAG: Fic family protein [Proteobacteria bacterium]|nr:Fic family protein [Pseudomonadota bacterium]
MAFEGAMVHLNEDTEHLADLLSDFGCHADTDALLALTDIAGRYRALNDRLEDLVAFIQSHIKNPAHDPCPLAEMGLRIHGYLFSEILNNAGQYRRETDPKGGPIYFGGTAHQSLKPAFEGRPAITLEAEMLDCYRLLFDFSNPVRSAAWFYQRYSQIHPFYDANGRIARLFVTAYLVGERKFIRWGELSKARGKFIKKLNACHKRSSVDSFPEYLGYLTSFLDGFVSDMTEFINYAEEGPATF